MIGGVELGGTHVVCAVGPSAGTITEEVEFATRGPVETLAEVAAFLRVAGQQGALDAVGIAAFGPLELRLGHPDYGRVLSTPKPGWTHADVRGTLAAALGVPVGMDTDVNGAALAEGHLGAAQGLGTFVYMTVGTGIGVGAVVEGRLLHGLTHPEMGHVSVPRQPGDHQPSRCRFHADCLEGMASGPAVADRWGPGEALRGDVLERAVALEAAYLAAGLRNIVYALAPERVVVGGGVAAMPGLIAKVGSKLVDALNGYPGLPEHAAEGFVVRCALGARAGVVGAMLLAEQAAAARPGHRPPGMG